MTFRQNLRSLTTSCTLREVLVHQTVSAVPPLIIGHRIQTRYTRAYTSKVGKKENHKCTIGLAMLFSDDDSWIAIETLTMILKHRPEKQSTSVMI